MRESARALGLELEPEWAPEWERASGPGWGLELVPGLELVSVPESAPGLVPEWALVWGVEQ